MISRRPALGFIFVTVVLDILGIGLIIPILPRLVKSFEGGDAAAASEVVGSLMALYSLMQFICAPVLGSLSDRFGRRPIILTSLLGSGLDYFLLAFAPNLGWFFVGLIGAAFGLGFIIGPVMGGWLGNFSLRLPFMVAGGLTLLNWAYGLLVLP